MSNVGAESTLGALPLSWWVVGVGLLLILPFAFGLGLGLKRHIVVYRNHLDVMVVGGLYLIPASIAALAVLIAGGGGAGTNDEAVFELRMALFSLALVLDALLLLFIVVRTWLDNRNVLKMLLALYVKIPLGVFFFAQFGNIFGGKQATSRRKSVFWALLLTPLIQGLVRDKQGSFPTPLRRRS